MLRKVKLYGKLAKFVGKRVLEADVHNAAEAVKFLVANWPALEQHMAKQYYKVDVGSSALALDGHRDGNVPFPKAEVIHAFTISL